MHCGFCLPTCPTYALWGEEMDSPRGRIYLMEMAAKGEIPLEGAFTTHIDRCLGCMACVTACPSGVQYDRLLEATRPQIERHVTRTRADRWFREAIFTLFPYKRRLRAASIGGALYQKLRPKSMDKLMARVPQRFERLVAMESLLPPVRVRDAFARIAPRTPAVGPRRGRVGLLTGCVQDVFFHPVNEATVRVLAAEGWDVIAPREQACCGALGLHAGREAEAAERAKKLIATFERAEVDTIATNVAGCGSSMKEYGELLADDPEWAERASAFAAKVRDISEIVDETLADPRGAAATRSRRRSSTTTPATSGTPRRSAPSPGACCAPSRAWSSPSCRRRRSAAGRRGSTTCSSPRPRAISGGARRTTSAAPGPTCSSPPTPAACCRSASTSRASSRCSTRSS